MTRRIGTWCAVLLAMWVANTSVAMETMDDESLDGVMAQASLFAVDYIPPGGGNPNTNIGFYRLALDAEMQMNANIKNLSLGCGGVKGAGVCDINLDNVRLTGPTASSATDSGPLTSATLTRPFLSSPFGTPARRPPAKSSVSGSVLSSLSAKCPSVRTLIRVIPVTIPASPVSVVI